MTTVHEPTAGVRRLSLRKNFSWALAGNFLYALCQLGILFVIQATGSLELVGSYSLALALCVPIFLLTNLQLRTLQTTDSQRKFHFSDYAGVRAAMTPLALLILIVIATCGHYSRETALVIIAMGLSKAIETASELCYGAFQQHERLDYVSWSLCWKGITALTIIGGTVALTGNLVLALCLVSVAWLFVFLLYDFRNVYRLFEHDQTAATATSRSNLRTVWSELRPRWRGAAVWKIVLCGLPLGVGGLLLSATDSFPNIFVEWKFGARDLGVFALLLTVSFAGLPVVNALGQAVTPRLAQNYANGNVRGFQQVLFKAVLLGCLFGLALIVGTYFVGEWVLALCFGADVAAHSDLLLMLMCLAPLKYGFRFFGNGLTATRRFSWVLRFQLVGLALLVGLAPLFAIWWGMMGVAVAILLATFIRSSLFAWQIQHELETIAANPVDVNFVRQMSLAARALWADFQQVLQTLRARLNPPATSDSTDPFRANPELTPASTVKR